MEKKYGLAVLASAVVCVVFFTCAYQAEYRIQQKKQELELEKMVQEREEEKAEESLSTDGEAHKEDVFYLKNREGYVVVYHSDKTTVYEYTNIAVSDLPLDIQKELLYGKRVESVEKLYGFLENYSS